MDSNSSVTMVKTPTPPKTIYGDRFWSNSSFSGNSGSPYSGKGGGGPLPEFEGGSNNQRIECAENGKSYLQLGTMGQHGQGGQHHHHHLPVPPVAMQPKTSHMVRIRHHNLISFIKISSTANEVDFPRGHWVHSTHM